MMDRMTRHEWTVAAWVAEIIIALGAALLGGLQFFDDGGSLLFQLSEKVLEHKYAVGMMFLGMGLAGLVMATALRSCHEMRIFLTLCQGALWIVVIRLYLKVPAVRPIVAMAILMAALAAAAFVRLVVDYARRK